MRSGILLSVREKATRLPGKVLMPLGSGNVTEHLIRRLKQSRKAASVVVATSDDPRDEVLCRIAAMEGVKCFRGSQDDKLVRYRDAALTHGFDFVVIVDGDDPFVSVTHIDRLITHAETDPVDYVIFTQLPVGATGFGVSREALKRVCATKQVNNTEIWGHLFISDSSLRCVELDESNAQLRRPEVRMTLDYPEDYAFFRAVADGLASAGRDTRFENVMDYLADHPEVVEINRGVAAAYEAHLRKSMGQ